jgi:hypothetical protein
VGDVRDEITLGNQRLQTLPVEPKTIALERRAPHRSWRRELVAIHSKTTFEQSFGDG